MKQRIFYMFFTLGLISASAMGQAISVAPVEGEMGWMGEIVLTAEGMDTNITALQFNLTLPDELFLHEGAIVKGVAAQNHEISVRWLEHGKYLFVLYNMDKALITDGELLRLPVFLPSDSVTLVGNVTNLRMATTEAISQEGTGTSFIVRTLQRGDVNGDGVVSVSDVTSLVNAILGRTASPSVADVNHDGQVSISDVTALVNIVLGR